MAAGFLMGPLELFMLLFFSGSGQAADLVGLFSAEDYFKSRGVQVSFEKLIELAATEPSDAKTQVAQLLALRGLAEEPDRFKKSDGYAQGKAVLEQIAAGTKASDRLGFAKEYALLALARLEGKTPPDGGLPDSIHDLLGWFPADVTMVTALDVRRQGPLALPDKSMGALLKNSVLGTQMKELYDVAETLGNVRIEGVANAIAQQKAGQGTMYFRGRGKANHRWLLAFLKSKNLNLTTEEAKAPGDVAITILRGKDEPLMALIGDTDLVFAFDMGAGQKHEEALKTLLAVRGKKQANIFTGSLQGRLKKADAKAAGLVVGRFPEEVQNSFTGLLPAFPKDLFAQIVRRPQGLDVEAEGLCENEDKAKEFVKSASAVRQQALGSLKALKEKLPQLVPVEGLVNSMQIQSKGNAAHFQMHLSHDFLRGVPALLETLVPRPAPPGN